MIYVCWGCGHRIRQRTTSSDFEIFHLDQFILPEEIGQHLLYDHRPFCNDYCINVYQLQKTKPIFISDIDGTWDDDWWKKERKIGRIRPIRKIKGLRRKKIPSSRPKRIKCNSDIQWDDEQEMWIAQQ